MRFVLENPLNQMGTHTRRAGACARACARASSRASRALTQEGIAKAGSASELIHLLHAGSDDAKAYALWALSLCIEEGNQQTVRRLVNARECS